MALYLGNQKIGGLSAIMQEGVSINVAYGIALPNAIVNNQIFVITNTPPTNIYVDTDAPINPTIGDMWIVVAAGGKAGITFKEGSSSLRIRFTRAIQWNGSDWSAKNGYLGIAGSWVQFAVSKLPEGYTEVEYIQSSGTQYIDTGYYVNSGDNYAFEMIATFPSSNNGYMGANGYMQLLINNQYSIGYGSTGVLGTKDIVNIKYVDDVETLTVNGSVIASKSWSGVYSSANVKIGIFQLGNANNVWWTNNNPLSGYLYSYKLYKNNILVRNFVPCINPSNVVGLFDLVSGTFYDNAGTGTFIAGEKV